LSLELRGAVDVCSGGPTTLNAPATTFDNVVNTDLS